MKQVQERPETLAEVDIFDLMIHQENKSEGVRMIGIVRSFSTAIKAIKFLDESGSSQRDHELVLGAAMSKLMPLVRANDEPLLASILVKLMGQV